MMDSLWESENQRTHIFIMSHLIGSTVCSPVFDFSMQYGLDETFFEFMQT